MYIVRHVSNEVLNATFFNTTDYKQMKEIEETGQTLYIVVQMQISCIF